MNPKLYKLYKNEQLQILAAKLQEMGIDPDKLR